MLPYILLLFQLVSSDLYCQKYLIEDVVVYYSSRPCSTQCYYYWIRNSETGVLVEKSGNCDDELLCLKKIPELQVSKKEKKSNKTLNGIMRLDCCDTTWCNTVAKLNEVVDREEQHPLPYSIEKKAQEEETTITVSVSDSSKRLFAVLLFGVSMVVLITFVLYKCK